MSRYEIHEEEYRRTRPRDRSPDYYSGGGPRLIEPEHVASGALPSYPVASPRDSGALQLPPTRYRPRSVPPMSTTVAARDYHRRRRSRSRSSSRSSASSTDKTKIEKAGDVLKDKFSDSTTGLGVGLLGAAVGAWVAHEATDAHSRRQSNREYDDYGYLPESPKDNSKSKIALTVLGAVVGGLGANAIEKRVEDSRERDKEKQLAWERKHGRRDGPAYVEDERDFDVRRGRRGRRDFDDDDYVYDDRQPSRRRSVDTYRYRDDPRY